MKKVIDRTGRCQRSFRGAVLTCLLAVPAAAGAGENKTAPGVSDVWRNALPNTLIREVRPEPHFWGMYEIVMDDKVVYGDATGRYLIFGHIYDVRTQQDITQQRIDEVAAARRIPWESLPLDHALREDLAPPDAPKLAVLFSAQCPWCKKLYDDVKSEKDKDGNITRKGLEFEADVRFMILAPEKPDVRVIGTRSPDYYPYYLADRIVCGGSPELNLRMVMQDEGFQELFRTDPFKAVLSPGSLLIRKLLPGSNGKQEDKCDSGPALAAVRDFARDHGLTSTPVLISGDGRVHRGYLPPDKLRAWLRAGKNAPSTPRASRGGQSQ